MQLARCPQPITQHFEEFTGVTFEEKNKDTGGDLTEDDDRVDPVALE
jgi:hypothetical protein